MKIKMISLVCEGRFGLGSIILFELEENMLRTKYEEVEEEIGIDESVFNGFEDVSNGKLVYISGDDGLELVMGIDGKFSFDEMKERFLVGIDDVNMEIYVEKMRNAFEMNDLNEVELY